MNFLASLFSCGRVERSNRDENCLPSFCATGNHKKMTLSERCKTKEGSTMTKLMSNSSRPASQMNDTILKKMPQPNFMVCRGCFKSNEKQINWGYLVGTVGCLPLHQNLIPSQIMKIRIGRGQELRSLHSLRSNSLDKLVVYWSELGEEFPLKELIRCRQPLILIVEEWVMVLQLMRIFEEQLFKALGEFCLKESGSRIFFNFINFQNKYLIEFEEAELFKNNAKEFLQKNLSFKLTQENFDLLLDKMTLNDYVQMRKDPLLLDRKIKHYLSEIEREKTEKQMATTIIETKVIAIQNYSDKFSDFCEDQIQRIRKQSKSSDVELEAEYFAKNRKACAEPMEPSSPQENLLIYYFNNNQEIQEEPEIGVPTRPINFVRKIRSKSEDATYVPEQNLDLDDEFFQKYQ